MVSSVAVPSPEPRPASLNAFAAGGGLVTLPVLLLTGLLAQAALGTN